MLYAVDIRQQNYLSFQTWFLLNPFPVSINQNLIDERDLLDTKCHIFGTEGALSSALPRNSNPNPILPSIAFGATSVSSQTALFMNLVDKTGNLYPIIRRVMENIKDLDTNIRSKHCVIWVKQLLLRGFLHVIWPIKRCLLADFNRNFTKERLNKNSFAKMGKLFKFIRHKIYFVLI